MFGLADRTVKWTQPDGGTVRLVIGKQIRIQPVIINLKGNHPMNRAPAIIGKMFCVELGSRCSLYTMAADRQKLTTWRQPPATGMGIRASPNALPEPPIPLQPRISAIMAGVTQARVRMINLMYPYISSLRFARLI